MGWLMRIYNRIYEHLTLHFLITFDTFDEFLDFHIRITSNKFRHFFSYRKTELSVQLKQHPEVVHRRVRKQEVAEIHHRINQHC